MESKKKKKIKTFKEFDPKKYINTEPVIKEAKSDTVVFSFGRMNPLTVGHEKLVDKLKSVAKSNNADARLYISHSQNTKKDPLSYKDKYTFARKAFGDVVTQSSAKQVIQIAQELQNMGYNNMIMVVGSDRVKEFENLLNRYNGKEYNFDSIKVVSAGKRDPDAEGVEGMSGTKLRAIAKSGDFDTFKQAAPSGLSDADKMKMMKLVQKNLDEALTAAQRRNRAIAFRKARHKIALGRKKAARRRASPEKLKQRARKQALNQIKNRLAGENGFDDLSYAERQNIEKRMQRMPKARVERLAKKLLPAIKRREREKFQNKKTNEAFEQRFLTELVPLAALPALGAVGSAIIRHGPTVARALQQMGSNLGGPPSTVAIDQGARKVTTVANKVKKVVTGPQKEAQDPDVKDMPGSQPAGYYKGIPKDKKDDRARHFSKYAKMDDDNPKAYKPAPGDKEAETKPSNHTKKFKAMFGEKNPEEPRHIKKRPHMLMAQNNSVKFDKRFKIFKKSVNESKEDLHDQIVDLMESVEGLFESNPLKSVRDKAEKAGIPYEIAKDVFDRGVAAWRTGHRPGTTPAQWGLARLNSFATGGKTTKTADKDLHDKWKGKKEELEEAPLKATRRDAESIMLDQLKKYLKNATPDQLKHVGDMIGKKVSVFGVGPKSIVMFEEESGAGEWGTDKLTSNYKKATPGQDEIEEAEYQGREVKLNDPIRSPKGEPHKFHVYVRNDKGNIVKVGFGDPNSEIKRDDPGRRSNFRARHQCDTDPGPKWKARYWSCKMWEKGKKVSELD